MKSQKQIWNNIAKEWTKFREKPIKEVQDFLKKQTGNVLDLGSGSGRHLVKLKKGKIYLVDFSNEMIKLAKKKAKEKNIDAEFFVCNMEKIPFGNDFFDCAICIDSLHCVEEEEKREKTILELFRVLKPRAQAMVSVWNKNSKRFKNSSKEKFVNWRSKGERYYYLYDKDEIYALFEKAGFKIIKKFKSDNKIMFVGGKV